MKKYFISLGGGGGGYLKSERSKCHYLFDFSQEARAEEERMAARFANDIEIAKSQRDFELKKAAYDQEVQTKKATSDLAYDLQVYSYLCYSYSFSSVKVRDFVDLLSSYLFTLSLLGC